LSIQRPPGFHFLPDDYVLINIPQVARYEWHPFTLSSAPEDLRLLTVHLQSAGNWTNKVFDRYKYMVADGPRVFGGDDVEAPTERIWVDGPYASSARHVFNCAHVVLIGAGIGK
jgi:NAD(P)H-flavin reductase